MLFWLTLSLITHNTQMMPNLTVVSGAINTLIVLC